MLVKGQVVAAYYPDGLLRQSGDIDFSCDSLNFKKAQNATREQWGDVPDWPNLEIK